MQRSARDEAVAREVLASGAGEHEHSLQRRVGRARPVAVLGLVRAEVVVQLAHLLAEHQPPVARREHLRGHVAHDRREAALIHHQRVLVA